jgi:short subunit dehydrogenase-like uncharacterized protein
MEHVMEHSSSTTEVWVLGATGRSGRTIAAKLVATGTMPVLVGRDRAGLEKVAAAIGEDLRTVVAPTVEAIIAEIGRQRPAVVVNTIGPFTETGVLVAQACLPSSHYLDLANDMVSVPALLDLHDDAVAAGRTLVTGAGFGVLATESVVLKLCEDRRTPSRVRVDAVPSLASEAGVIGWAFAATLVDAMALGGRRFDRGRLVRDWPGSEAKKLTLPDGQTASTGSGPTGELHAAWLASGSPSVVAGSTFVPTAPMIRAFLPVATGLLSVPAVRRLARRRLARVRMKPGPMVREHSWGHAQVTWPDGTSRGGWLRLGDAQIFTTAVAAEVATRLAHGDAHPGAYTPGAAFGPELAADVGGEFILD